VVLGVGAEEHGVERSGARPAEEEAPRSAATGGGIDRDRSRQEQSQSHGHNSSGVATCTGGRLKTT
jgi:hypothetical protein